MKKRTSRHTQRRLVTLLVALALLLVAGGGALYLQTLAKGPAHASSPRQNIAMRLTRPQYHMIGPAAMGMQLPCQAAVAANRCYVPQQIQNAYDIAPLYNAGINGAGHTIVIIDAFQSPTLRHDLHLFDQIFGLNDPRLRIFAPDGLAPFNPKDQVQVSWAAEITLDVEWAHAVAPGAAIDLVLANPNNDPKANTFSGFLLNLLRATSFAVANNLGDVISMSFGGNESCAGAQTLQLQHQVFQAAAAKGITLLASSGDRGAAQVNCAFTTFVQSVSTPASDPLVTAVGGTTLNADAASGAYVSESGWSGSGGGFSTAFARPTFQQGIKGITTKRGLPDIAYDADPRSGVVVVWSSSGQGKDLAVVFGGTSAGAPQWAGITALLNQHLGKRAGFLNSALYRLAQSQLAARVFHDVTTGTNTFSSKDANGNAVTVPGFQAAAGWDAVTGLGTPNVTRLVQFLPNFL